MAVTCGQLCVLRCLESSLCSLAAVLHRTRLVAGADYGAGGKPAQTPHPAVDKPCGKPGSSGLFQVRHVPAGQCHPAHGGNRHCLPTAAGGDASADRNLLLHVRLPVLHNRRLPERGAFRLVIFGVRALRQFLSPSGGRANSAGAQPAAADCVAKAALAQRNRLGSAVVLLRIVLQSGHGRCVIRAGRRCVLCLPSKVRRSRCMVCGFRLFRANLLRFQRLFTLCDRTGIVLWLYFSGQFPPSLRRTGAFRFLAPLACFPFQLAARLRVCSPWRQSCG